MSLMDAMLLEGYRDLKEVYIALRTDGLKGSGTIDDPYDGGTRLDVPMSGTIHFDNKEMVGVSTDGAHGLVSGGSVTISNVNGQSAAAYNATHSPVTKIDNYAFNVPAGTAPANPPGPGLPGSELYIMANAVIIFLYWPVMKVTLTEGHGINKYDVVHVSGASKPPFNGDFVVVATGTDFIWCLLTGLHDVSPLPDISSFSGSCTGAKVIHRFDALLRTNADGTTVVPANSIIHIGPGTFETRGWTNLFFMDYEANPSRSNVGWQPKTGMKLRGSGIDVTVLKLVHATHPLAQCSIIENSNNIDMAHFEASDFTMDCNIGGQPRFDDGLPVKAPARVTCGGTNILGDFTRLKRLRAINWGCQSGPECFVFRVGDGSSRKGIANVIEDCIAEKPGSTNTHESTLFNHGGHHDTAQVLSAAIRNNYCNTDYTDPDNPAKTILSELVAVASTSINGNSPSTSGSFTITTKRPHHLKKGDSFILNGVLRKVDNYYVNDDNQTTNPYVSHHTRSYRVTDVFSATSFQTEVLTDYPHPSGYQITFSFAHIGATFNGTAVGAGSGCVIEGNRQYGWQIAAYQDTGSTRDTVVRDNYWSNVKDGLYLNMGSSSYIVRGANGITVSGTEVTIFTPANAHDLAPGHAVDVSEVSGTIDLRLVNSTHTVKAVTSTSFTFDVPAAPVGTVGGSSIKYRHRWQKRWVFIENNVIDVYRFDNDSVGGSTSPDAVSSPRGIILYGIIPDDFLPSGFQNNSNVQPAYIFPKAIIRDNVIGYYDGGTDTGKFSIAITVIRGDSVLVGGNVVNLVSEYGNGGPDFRIRETTARDVDLRNNTTAAGEVVPALNTNNANAIPPQLTPIPDAYDDLISDATLVTVL